MNYCWLFHPDLNKFDKRSAESSLTELRLLAKSIDLIILFSKIIKINNIRSASYFGSGKIEEIN